MDEGWVELLIDASIEDADSAGFPLDVITRSG